MAFTVYYYRTQHNSVSGTVVIIMFIALYVGGTIWHFPRSWTNTYSVEITNTIFKKISVLKRFDLKNDSQNSVYEWARDHRLHHKYSDTDADPHNSKRGFFFSHVGWLMCRKHPELFEKCRGIDTSDLLADPIVAFQKKWVAVFLVHYYNIIVCDLSSLMISNRCRLARPSGTFGRWLRWRASSYPHWSPCTVGTRLGKTLGTSRWCCGTRSRWTAFGWSTASRTCGVTSRMTGMIGALEVQLIYTCYSYCIVNIFPVVNNRKWSVKCVEENLVRRSYDHESHTF